MTIGNSLRERDVQYIAVKDETTHTWRILDTWHDSLKGLDPESDVPDDNEAVTILTEGGFISLVREATRLGVLQNANLGGVAGVDTIETQEMEDKIVKYEEEISKYKEEIYKLKQKTNESESFRLKEKAMGTVLRLAAMSDAATLLSEE
tara:strand:- start:180 stop:626 length:447 start_codon:yes stop_codon:yes gene_type:complete